VYIPHLPQLQQVARGTGISLGHDVCEDHEGIQLGADHVLKDLGNVPADGIPEVSYPCNREHVTRPPDMITFHFRRYERGPSTISYASAQLEDEYAGKNRRDRIDS
jgi:hypothetical protein